MIKTTEAIREIAGKLGLKMSYKKTEIMSIGQASAFNPIVPLSIEVHIKVGEPLQVPRSFLHVKELNSRIGKDLAAFRELDKV